MSLDLDSILDSLADALAERVTARLNGPPKPERIPLDQVSAHGAPSARWVTAKAREGAITLHGPRGGRFVYAADLAALLGSVTIRRQGRPPVQGGTDLAADARAAVAELAARRGAK
jgi:hypothetical protein